VNVADDADFRAKLAVLEERSHDMQTDIRELYEMIQSGPNSIRTRLHKMEADRAAADAATAAVEAVKLVYAQASQRRFSRFEKTVGLVFAFVLMATSVVSLIFAVAHN
jgi:CRISPR/Cas system CSM-associated protein Csm2 small subunit